VLLIALAILAFHDRVRPELIPVPDVSGNSTADAAQILRDAGFTVEGVRGDPERTVRGTDPPAGERVRRGTGITLITRG